MSQRLGHTCAPPCPTDTCPQARTAHLSTRARWAARYPPPPPPLDTSPESRPHRSPLDTSVEPPPPSHLSPPTQTRAGVLVFGAQHPATSLPAHTSHLPPKREPACSRLGPSTQPRPCPATPLTSHPNGSARVWCPAPGHVPANLSLPHSTDVLIVGAGPAGLATAISLLTHTITNITIIDVQAAGAKLSCAIVIHAHTIEVRACARTHPATHSPPHSTSRASAVRTRSRAAACTLNPCPSARARSSLCAPTLPGSHRTHHTHLRSSSRRQIPRTCSRRACTRSAVPSAPRSGSPGSREPTQASASCSRPASA